MNKQMYVSDDLQSPPPPMYTVPGPVFCPLLGVSPGSAETIEGQ